MSKITVCDICDDHAPQIEIKIKKKHTHYGWGDKWRTSQWLQICERCWPKMVKYASSHKRNYTHGSKS